MEVKILAENENALLKRKEVTFQVEHNQTGSTPPRLEVKNAIAKLLKRDANLVFIKKLETKTGTRIAFGVANVYTSIEDAKLIEPEYILKRNVPPEKPKEEGKE
ncbi:MAG: 30S ribosomal protein S24e [Candidatus Bathyarchaeota archaeon]|jgi:ribosomal protein S24E|nr:30S ribosomal protein S24e [Candidatus Bathyarchaeota archaeon A05DMB-3]MDH7606279.1 30S ribosomal protein S24e [Candidatus Bathyarchaeota archaeon]